MRGSDDGFVVWVQVLGLVFEVQFRDMRFRLGIRVLGFGFGVWCRVLGFEFRVGGLG